MALLGFFAGACASRTTPTVLVRPSLDASRPPEPTPREDAARPGLDAAAAAPEAAVAEAPEEDPRPTEPLRVVLWEALRPGASLVDFVDPALGLLVAHHEETLPGQTVPPISRAHLCEMQLRAFPERVRELLRDALRGQEPCNADSCGSDSMEYAPSVVVSFGAPRNGRRTLRWITVHTVASVSDRFVQAGSRYLAAARAWGLAQRCPPTPEYPAPPAPPPPHAPAASCPSSMALLPTGTFQMGGEDRTSLAVPVHPATVTAFCLDRTEVTVAAYERCVRARACTAPNRSRLSQDDREPSQLCNWGRRDRAEHPVNCVDHAQAEAYCRFAHARLPTEQEWEFAARGTSNRSYPWGNADPDATRANQRDDAPPPEDGFLETAPVGHFAAGATPEGVLDLAGNVREWTADWFLGPYSVTLPTNGRDYEALRLRDHWVLRGGSAFTNTGDELQSFRREEAAGADRDMSNGFRCASDGTPR